jgi:hypothetical protein
VGSWRGGTRNGGESKRRRWRWWELKGGGGWEKQISRVGGSAPKLFMWQHCVTCDVIGWWQRPWTISRRSEDECLFPLCGQIWPHWLQSTLTIGMIMTYVDYVDKWYV